MCVVTGQHMVKEDWCLCPRSRMPALLSHYESHLQYEQVGTHTHTPSSYYVRHNVVVMILIWIAAAFNFLSRQCLFRACFHPRVLLTNLWNH